MRQKSIIVLCAEGDLGMDNLINRQAAIAVADYTDYTGLAIEDIKKVTDEVVKGLKQLPSTQPERKRGKWVEYDGDWLKTMCKCSECGAVIDVNEKYRNFFCYHCGADMRGEEVNRMDDLISRQVAIDMLAAMQGQCTNKAALIQNSKIWQQIKDLPPAQSEMRWIPCSEGLPEDDEIVLVSDGIDYAVAFWRSDADAWDDPWHGWLDSFEFDVKAWMPLPELPIEKQQE